MCFNLYIDKFFDIKDFELKVEREVDYDDVVLKRFVDIEEEKENDCEKDISFKFYVLYKLVFGFREDIKLVGICIVLYEYNKYRI